MIRRFISEFIGTFLFLFTAMFTVAVFDQSYVNAPIAGCAMLIAMLYLFQPVSGGYFNPAASLSGFLDKRLSPLELAINVAGELVGGYAAGYAVMRLSGSTIYGLDGLMNGSTVQTFWREIIMSFVYISIYLSASSSRAERGTFGLSNAIIGVAYSILTALGTGLGGCVMNPAKTLAILTISPGVINGSALAIFLCGPLIGAVLAWLMYRLMIRPALASERLTEHQPENVPAKPVKVPKALKHSDDSEKPEEARSESEQKPKKKHLRLSKLKKRTEKQGEPAEQPKYAKTPHAAVEQPKPIKPAEPVYHAAEPAVKPNPIPQPSPTPEVKPAPSKPKYNPADTTEPEQPEQESEEPDFFKNLSFPDFDKPDTDEKHDESTDSSKNASDDSDSETWFKF